MPCRRSTTIHIAQCYICCACTAAAVGCYSAQLICRFMCDKCFSNRRQLTHPPPTTCSACGSISGHCTRVMCTRHTKRCLFTFYILICYRCYATMLSAETVIRIACKRVMKSQTAKMMMAKMSTNIYFTCVFTTPKFVPCLRLICDYVNENRRWTMGDAEASKYLKRYFVIMASRLRIHCSK